MLRSVVLATSVILLGASSALACEFSRSKETAQTPVPAQTVQAPTQTLIPTDPAKTDVAEAPKTETSKTN